MNWYWLLLMTLAVYRVARMIAYEDGPWDVFLRLRSLAFQKLRQGQMGDHWVYRGLSCPLCVSFWLSWLAPFAPLWLLTPLAVAGAVVVIHQLLERKST